MSKLMITKTKNGMTLQLYSNVGTISQTVRSGNGPYIDKYHARTVLHTVFSTSQ